MMKMKKEWVSGKRKDGQRCDKEEERDQCTKWKL